MRKFLLLFICFIIISCFVVSCTNTNSSTNKELNTVVARPDLETTKANSNEVNEIPSETSGTKTTLISRTGESMSLYGWEFPNLAKITDEDISLLRDAMGDICGIGIKLIGKIASNMGVKGEEHLYLCFLFPIMPDVKMSLGVVQIKVDYEPLGELLPAFTKKASLGYRKTFDYSYLIEENIPGAYTLADNPNLTNDINSIFEKAYTKYTGNTALIPQAYVGSQVVNGTNHLYLCIEKGDNDFRICLAQIYETLNGNCEITNISYIR